MIEVTQDNPVGVAGVQTHGAYLRFSHPHIKDDLVVSSGANSIKWVYTLNTNQQSTIGGEVIQVLGTYVGPLVIEGMAASVAELVKIKSWFVQVFERMGTVYKSGGNNAQFRDETAVKFEYPARGWSFMVMPTKLRGFKYDKSVFAPPWQIEAEIVTDNAMDFLNAATFSAFTGPLMNPVFYDTGYSDPTGHGQASRFVNPMWSGSISGLGSTMGDNFQRLVEQYLGGGFGDFAYNSLLPYAHPSKTVADEYNALFGTPGIQTSGGGTGSGSSNAGSGTSSGGGGGGSNASFTDTNDIAGDAGINDKIVQAAEAAGISAVLSLAVAQNESSSDPDTYNGITAVGAYQFYIKTSLYSTEGKAAQQALRAAGLSPGHGSGTSHLVTANYPFDHQLADFLGWTAAAKPSWLAGKDVNSLTNDEIGQWAELAQVSGTYCTPNSTNGGVSSSSVITSSFLSHVQAARAAIQFTSGNSTIPVSGDAIATAKALLAQYNKKWFDDNGRGLAQIQKVAAGKQLVGAEGAVSLDYRTMDTILRLIGAGYTIGTYAWCEDHSDDGLAGHTGGKAVDISSVNGVAINTEAAGAYTRQAAHWINTNISPRQLISGGFGQHSDDYCRSQTIPSPSFYGETTMAQHTNHIHVGY